MCEIESSKHEARNGPLLGYEIVAQIQKVDPDEKKETNEGELHSHLINYSLAKKLRRASPPLNLK